MWHGALKSSLVSLWGFEINVAEDMGNTAKDSHVKLLFCFVVVMTPTVKTKRPQNLWNYLDLLVSIFYFGNIIYVTNINHLTILLIKGCFPHWAWRFFSFVMGWEEDFICLWPQFAAMNTCSPHSHSLYTQLGFSFLPSAAVPCRSLCGQSQPPVGLNSYMCSWSWVKSPGFCNFFQTP